MGVEQLGLFSWYKVKERFGDGIKIEVINNMYADDVCGDGVEVVCSAFTVAELGGMLTVVIDLWGEEANIIISKGKFSKDYCIDYLGNNKEIKKSDKNLSNALAKMLVYLLEVKLLKIKKGGKHGITQI